MADKENKKLENEEAVDKKTTENQDQKTEAEKKPGKIKEFFVKNKNKVAAGLGIAGAIGVGVIADRIGIKFGSKKKTDDPAEETPAE